MSDRRARWGRAAAALLLAALLLAAGGCSARGGLTLPDAAAIAAGERARAALEQERRLYADDALAAALGRIAQPVLDATLAAREPGAPAVAASRGWRVVVLDDPEPEALLLADRSVFLSRGALIALEGAAGFEALIVEAVTRFASGAFRALRGEGLVAQPLPLPLPLPLADPATDPPSAEGVVSAPVRTDFGEWIELLSGLVYGERPEFGAALGPRVLFPVADLQLVLPTGGRFVSDGHRRFRAPLGDQSAPGSSLTVRELPLAADEPPVDGSLAAEHALIERLAGRIVADQEAAGRRATVFEFVRVRGFPGVRARWDDGEGASGRVAILRTPGAWVQLAADCGPVGSGACEAAFLDVLRTADRLWGEPAPGPLRLRAWKVDRPGPAREAIRRLASTSDVAAEELLRVNHAWLERELAAGDLVLVLERDPAAPIAADPLPPPESSR